MAVVFQEYDLLAKSGLFDANFYVATNPDVAALSTDPLMHYLEHGCHERRNPSSRFDTQHYLTQCERLGALPANALLHYLTDGVKRGLTPSPGHPSAQASSDVSADALQLRAAPMLCVDVPRIVGGAADSPIRGGLSIVGWGWAATGVVSVDIALDGVRITSARCGLRRPDVAAAHPDREGALLSGYAAHLPPKVLAVGRHRVTVSLQDANGLAATSDFNIDVQAIATERGPWALRRKMSQAEVDLQLDTLTRLSWRPAFRVLLPLTKARQSFAAVRQSIESLRRQKYPDWELCLIPTPDSERPDTSSKRLRARLLEGYDEIAARVQVLSKPPAPPPAATLHFLVRMAAGDELGCDALLQFALASAFDRSADLLYCDERRKSPVDGTVDAFFKPAWSPDLLLSTDYMGRSWCADSRLIERTALALSDMYELADYDLAIRLTEAAKNIRHVPRLLYHRSELGNDSAEQERRALRSALRRRKIVAEIRKGKTDGHYRVQRKLSPGRVSVIIPTCAAEEMIKTCIESLRGVTRYHNYEIICIENIPDSNQQRRKWLGQHADVVVRTCERFNWSRYNNVAATRATGKYLLFLNDDIEIIDAEWLDALVEQAQRPEVGVVGPLLLYPDRTIQHAGVMLDQVGRGRHAFRHLRESDPGYFGLALTQRNVISVTGACLMTRRETFDAQGRFDEAHSVVNNDLDFCLRTWRKGLLNVYTPYARLVHHELVSRSRLPDQFDAGKFYHDWGSVIAVGDPYFNPNLSREHEAFTIDREPCETIYAGHPIFARSSIRRILVVKLDHIGDCVTALPALRRLKQIFPEAQLSVLAASSTRSIWSLAGTVEETIDFNFFHARSALGKLKITEAESAALAKSLRARRFDLAIDLRKQPDTREVLQLSGADILVGFDHQGRFPWLDVALEWDEDAPLRSKHGHIADDLLALVEAVATQSDSDRSPVMSAGGGSLGLPRAKQQRLLSKPLICIHPASGSPMRQWPLHRFAQLIDLLNDGSVHIALIGGSDEKQIAGQVMADVTNAKNVFNLVGELTLSELPQLIARAVLFVGNNSGPKHIAAALGTSTVGIHSGVVDAFEWGPIGKRAIAVRRQMSCSPCYIEQVKDCPRALACLRGLTVADVYDSCRTMIAAGVRADARGAVGRQTQRSVSPP